MGAFWHRIRILGASWPGPSRLWRDPKPKIHILTASMPRFMILLNEDKYVDKWWQNWLHFAVLFMGKTNQELSEMTGNHLNIISKY